MVLALMMPTLSGCTSAPVDLDSKEHTSLLQQDRLHAEQGTGQQRISLTLEEAIERGITHNLDARVAAMEILVSQKKVTLEKLKALPSVTASATYTGRDNDGASSSRSIESGLQSLEPSQSSDRDRKLANLDINWNLLDVALAYADAKKSRRRIQNRG
jgi:outer membrane protein TolC